jgi:hypothetical protein
MRILDHLDMYTLEYQPSAEGLATFGPPSTILCSKGFWVYDCARVSLHMFVLKRVFNYRFTPRQVVF